MLARYIIFTAPLFGDGHFRATLREALAGTCTNTETKIPLIQLGQLLFFHWRQIHVFVIPSRCPSCFCLTWTSWPPVKDQCLILHQFKNIHLEEYTTTLFFLRLFALDIQSYLLRSILGKFWRVPVISSHFRVPFLCVKQKHTTRWWFQLFLEFSPRSLGK